MFAHAHTRTGAAVRACRELLTFPPLLAVLTCPLPPPPPPAHPAAVAAAAAQLELPFGVSDAGSAAKWSKAKQRLVLTFERAGDEA